MAAAAGVATVSAPAQHTAYVEIVIKQEPAAPDLASIEARVDCRSGNMLREAVDWLTDRSCAPASGAAVYVSDASAPLPEPATGMAPTGTVYAYEDADRIWQVREYSYASFGEDSGAHYAYVLTPDISERVDDDGRGLPVRGIVNLTKMGVAPGGSIELETTLGPGPQVLPEDPDVQHVRASAIGSPTIASGAHAEASSLSHPHR